MKTHFLKIFVIAVFIAASANSCESIEETCKRRTCITLNIAGSVRVQPSGNGIRNVPVTVSYSGGQWIRELGSGKTDKNGNFNFNVKFPLNEGGLFYVNIPVQNKYFNPRIDTEIIVGQNEDTYANLQNIHFDFYNKAQLTINLNRTQTDEFEYFTILSWIEEDFARRKNRFYTLYPDARDATRQIETAADVYTKIWCWKEYGNITTESVDSLICKQNVNNVININY